MITILPLLGKNLADLTLEDLGKVKKFLKLKVELTEELKDAGMALLKGENIHSVADLIQKPASVEKLISFFQPPEPVVVEDGAKVVRCPCCSLFHIVKRPEPHGAGGDDSVVRCPYCFSFHIT